MLKPFAPMAEFDGAPHPSQGGGRVMTSTVECSLISFIKKYIVIGILTKVFNFLVWP